MDWTVACFSLKVFAASSANSMTDGEEEANSLATRQAYSNYFAQASEGKIKTGGETEQKFIL